MAYSSEHLLYTFTGKLPGSEIWSVGIRSGASSVTDPAALLEYATGAYNAFLGALWTTGTLKFYNISQVTFDQCTVRHINTAGITTNQADYAPGPVAAGGVSQTAPNQACTVLSLDTPRSGRSYRGRMYLPTLAPEWGSGTGKITGAMATALAAGGALLVTDLNALVSTSPATGPFPCSIQSRTSGQPPAPINAVRVGNVIDTQRRRRDKEVELYVTVAV